MCERVKTAREKAIVKKFKTATDACNAASGEREREAEREKDRGASLIYNNATRK
jgi:hypothetical protein